MPVVLAGNGICASAVAGNGKMAALFLVPARGRQILWLLWEGREGRGSVRMLPSYMVLPGFSDLLFFSVTMIVGTQIDT